MDQPKDERIPGSWEWPEDIPRQRHTRTTPTNDTANGHSIPTPTTSDHRPQTSEHTNPGASANSRQRHWGPRTCRICLDTVYPTFHPPAENIPSFLQPSPRVTYDSEGGRLIRPCKCKGSVKYVHEDCLQHWRHSDPSYGARTFYNCPTCGFKYKLSRIGWANGITSAGMYIS
jgi:RING-variant finger protein